MTEFVLKQYFTQVAMNASTTFMIEGKVNWSVFEYSFKEFDFADAGIDKGLDLALDKYKLGKLKTALKISSSVFFDITYKDGVKVMTWSENSDKIIGDIITNLFLEGINKVAGKKGDDKLPITKLNKETLDLLTDYIKKTFVNTIFKNIKKESEAEEAPVSEKINSSDAMQLLFAPGTDAAKKVEEKLDRKSEK